MTGLLFADVDALLDDARSRIRRLEPAEAAAHVADGAILVDIRPAWQREMDGEVPGSLIVERNHLEWRLHPRSGARLPQARVGQEWIVFCTEGYTSSLAAAALTSLGILAADVVGGIKGWERAGLPVVATVTPVETVVGTPPLQAGAS
ncbi:sulfurtransferase [Aeromicrobium sp. Root495]|uniref:rhodanese-like domain-containing protein n=1 Tax=Aeromicrobium sp. Root495 TaxID=1736550 RepID=UPI0006F91A11|nr:rhodanese-like domain-containing protein [Aeromicrobium sp. Root495]KQY58265.1 sulfurtransferase [Aeromicrobium sp. Root495]RYJ06762.1 MAG: sulfurtransferase [Actinomycetales bacterium]